MPGNIGPKYEVFQSYYSTIFPASEEQVDYIVVDSTAFAAAVLLGIERSEEVTRRRTELIKVDDEFLVLCVPRSIRQTDVTALANLKQFTSQNI